MLIALAVLIVLGIASCVAVLAWLPAVAERKLNPVAERPPYAVGEEARRLHETLLIADLHADSLLWGRDLLVASRRGHVDVPRLIQAHVAIQAFTVVTKAPDIRRLNYERNDSRSDSIRLLAMAEQWPVRTWGSLKARALYQASRLRDAARRSQGRLVLIETKADLDRFLERRATGSRAVAGWLGLEGAHALEGDLDNVDALYAAGFRLIGLTHLADNDVAGSVHGEGKGGLTAFGRRVIERIEARRMLVDLAHASPRTIEDVLDAVTQPPIVSHTGLRSVCDNLRNLSDEHARRIAGAGGLIGIGYWSAAVGGATPEAIARSIRYAVDLVGVEHVALGSDFDGCVGTPFDVTGLPKLTEALIAQSFGEGEIRLLAGENVLRLLRTILPSPAEPTAP